MFAVFAADLVTRIFNLQKLCVMLAFGYILYSTYYKPTPLFTHRKNTLIKFHM